MSTVLSQHPTTLGGIKKRAKTLSKETGCKYFDALNSVAKLAGYENYNHAINQLGAKSAVFDRYPFSVTIWADWAHRRAEQSGRYELRVGLQRPWHELVSRTQLRGALGGLTQFNGESLYFPQTFANDFAAEMAVYRAARAMRMVSATGLLPIRWTRKAFPTKHVPGTRETEAILPPGEDHSSCWIDPVTKKLVFFDEPYASSDDDKLLARRVAWCKEHGFTMATPTWAGIHNPGGGTRLTMFSRDLDLVPFAQALDALPALGTGADDLLLEPTS